ncbi:MAG: hypothetical protein ACKOES_12680 [Planctomycetaceae bacterium]
MTDGRSDQPSSALTTQASPPPPHGLAALSPAVKARIGRVAMHVAIAAVVVLAVAPLADRVGGEALDGSFKRALAALATTRGLDAAISLAQSSEVSFSLGPGGSIGIGQVLDPVNDLVEQYGTLLMTSTTALGIQQVGLRLGRALGWWLFVPSLVALAAAAFAQGSMATSLATWGRRLFALALFARLAIPTAAWIDGIVADRFLEADYREATAVVERTTERLEEMKPDGPEKPWYERLNPVTVIGEQAKQLSDTLGTVAESIVNLVIYFTVSTIVLPLATLWLLSKTLGVIFGPRT